METQRRSTKYAKSKSNSLILIKLLRLLITSKIIGVLIVLKHFSTKASTLPINSRYREKLNKQSQEKLKQLNEFNERCLDSNRNLIFVNDINITSNSNTSYTDENTTGDSSKFKILHKNSSELTFTQNNFHLKGSSNSIGTLINQNSAVAVGGLNVII